MENHAPVENTRKIIKEELHAILEIEKISQQLAPYCMNMIKAKKDYAIKYKQKTAIISFDVQELDLSDDAFVNFLTINIEFKKEAENRGENEVGGGYVDGSIDQEIISNVIKYNGEIKIKLYNWGGEQAEITKFSNETTEKIFYCCLLFKKDLNDGHKYRRIPQRMVLIKEIYSENISSSSAFIC